MRHNQAQRVTVVRGERLAIMMRDEQHIVAVKISQRDIRGKTLLRVHQDMRCLSLWLYPTEEFPDRHALPLVVKAAPARDAMKVAGVAGLRQRGKLVPREPQRLLHQPPDTKIPLGRIKSGH